MRRHLQQHEVARLIQMLEHGSTQRDVAAAFGVTQSLVSRAWNQYLATGGYVRRPAKDAYDARPLAKTATSAKWLYVAVAVLPEHSRWTSCQPQDSESVTKLCATDSMRTAFTADHQHMVPFSHGNTVELDFAQDHQHWHLRHWRPILFTDESRVHVSATSSNTTHTVVGP